MSYCALLACSSLMNIRGATLRVIMHLGLNVSVSFAGAETAEAETMRFRAKLPFLVLLALTNEFKVLAFSNVDRIPSKCPGKYCGRTVEELGNISECGACPRGYRPDHDSLWSKCTRCDSTPRLYDWLYLGFMALLALILHWFFIDYHASKRKNFNCSGSLVILHVSAFLECVVASICTLLVVEPLGSFSVRSCPVKGLSDWYTMVYNPSPDYTSTLHCTQEAVFPLYTMVMIYYAFCLVCMMLVRPILSAKLVNSRGTKSIYAALYFLPTLVLIQAALSGLLYYGFPYLIIVVSVVTNAIHFSYFREQSVRYLLRENLTDLRNVTILLCHWIMHAYGIISITQFKDPSFHGPLLCLVPFPALFYIFTVKFTNPAKLEET